MQQYLHLLIVDQKSRTALIQWCDRHWLLPILVCPDRERSGRAILRWVEARGITGEIAGQWLGRLAPNKNAIDWLTVVDALGCRRETATETLRWMPLESLKSSESLLDYQHWAVVKAMSAQALPVVPGPFGTLTWGSAAKAWVRRTVGPIDEATLMPYRTSSHEVVLGLMSQQGRVYAKGLWRGRAMEAKITMALAKMAPESFARTLALETRPDGTVWWLTQECPGVSLAQDVSAREVIRVAEACARLQQRLLDGAVADVLELPDLDLGAAAAWAACLLEEAFGRGADTYRAVIERACQEVSRGDVPRCWIPLDLDPGNVLLDKDAVRFIDLDDSYFGPAPLAVASLTRRIHRSHPDLAAVEANGALHDAYVRAWPAAQRPRVSWTALVLVSQFLEDYLGWLRVVEKSQRGEVHGILDLTRERIVCRLMRAAIRSDCESVKPVND